ncbi:MAG TPA: cobalamin-binding protein [Anaerolineae bacterium]|nr:cobalamin-binding protein [Anaerolineae bacterium]
MLDAIYQSVIGGDVAGVTQGVQQALEAGHDPGEILTEAMIAAMAEVGRRFEAQEYFVPEMLIAARAMKEGLAILKPHLLEADIEPVGKVILGTVKGDLHDIGKNLVGMMLEGAGFEVIDLGVDVSPERFVEAIREHRPRFVGMSALLTTTMPGMRATIEALQKAGLRHQVVVMVGGAPVTQQYADQIGADLYAPDASSAASRAKALLEAS